MIEQIMHDLRSVQCGRARAFFFNRGFHALFIYRISNLLYRHRIPIVPLILTRLVQILYGIDVDYRATIAGGVCIVHGLGVVIGQGATIGKGVKIYHGVTLGIKDNDKPDDGYPTIGDHVMIGAGAKLLGRISIGTHSKIGANAVVLHDVPANSTAVGIPAKVIPKKIKRFVAL